jgi:hypothetical protein
MIEHFFIEVGTFFLFLATHHNHFLKIISFCFFFLPFFNKKLHVIVYLFSPHNGGSRGATTPFVFCYVHVENTPYPPCCLFQCKAREGHYSPFHLLFFRYKTNQYFGESNACSLCQCFSCNNFPCSMPLLSFNL